MIHRLEAACMCHIGRQRSNNEDNLFFDGVLLEQEHHTSHLSYRVIADGRGCFGVFDGMGGAEDGQVASYLAANTFAECCAAQEESQDLTEEHFTDAVQRMNTAVYLEGKRRGNNMGTTAVMIGFQGDAFIVANVGDSRAYRVRGGQMSQISLDHSEVLTAEQRLQRKPRLTQCIGRSPEQRRLEPYIASGFVEAGDRYLLCSDGLTDMVGEKEILSVLEQEIPAECQVEQLVTLALDNGGRDNITVIVIKSGN